MKLPILYISTVGCHVENCPKNEFVNFKDEYFSRRSSFFLQNVIILQESYSILVNMISPIHLRKWNDTRVRLP